MSKMKTVTLCGMEGFGNTAIEAKQDAMDKLSAVVSGEWTPFFLVHDDWRAIVAREPRADPRQWGYKILRSSDGCQDLYLTGYYLTRNDAICGAARHLAQNTGHYLGLEVWIGEIERQELNHYFDWQSAYAAAKANGCSDDECRARANQSVDIRLAA